VRLDRDAAHRSVARLGERLGLSPLETAAGIARVANQEMIRALRVVTVERGVDPRGYALMPFGGAGPMHAVAVAEELGVTRVVCPRTGGVLSALGLCVSDRRREITRTVLLSGDALETRRIEAEIGTLMDMLGGRLEHGAETETTYELRYSGQAFELALRDDGPPDPQRLKESFEAEHERRYGYRDAEAEVELVNIRRAVVVRGPRPELVAAQGKGHSRLRRPAWFGGRELDMEVLRGEPPAGLELTGPAVFELPETTLVVPPGWRASVDGHGSVVVHREGSA
jgi:N-methylhydantoinase A